MDAGGGHLTTGEQPVQVGRAVQVRLHAPQSSGRRDNRNEVRHRIDPGPPAFVRMVGKRTRHTSSPSMRPSTKT